MPTVYDAFVQTGWYDQNGMFCLRLTLDAKAQKRQCDHIHSLISQLLRSKGVLDADAMNLEYQQWYRSCYGVVRKDDQMQMFVMSTVPGTPLVFGADGSALKLNDARKALPKTAFRANVGLAIRLHEPLPMFVQVHLLWMQMYSEDALPPWRYGRR